MIYRAYFTREEAEALIPHLRPLMDRAMAIIEKLRADQETEADEEELVGIIREIEAWGCQVRRIEEGIVDFPAALEGQPVYFSWVYTEDRIGYYSEPEEYGDRRHPLPESLRAARPN